MKCTLIFSQVLRGAATNNGIIRYATDLLAAITDYPTRNNLLATTIKNTSERISDWDHSGRDESTNFECCEVGLW